MFEKPAYHTCIDTKELLFIENSLGEVHQKYMPPTVKNTPWKEFFTSMPCYAIFVANFCRSWNFYLLVLFQTSMFQDTFHAELTEVTQKVFFLIEEITDLFFVTEYNFGFTSSPFDDYYRTKWRDFSGQT